MAIISTSSSGGIEVAHSLSENKSGSSSDRLMSLMSSSGSAGAKTGEYAANALGSLFGDLEMK